MRPLAWKYGSELAHRGPVLLSATRFTFRSVWLMPAVLWHGSRLLDQWPTLAGAVGVWVAVDWRRATTYTVSAWLTEQDLQRWIRSLPHSDLMRRYRGRVVDSQAKRWRAEEFSRSQAWTEGWLQLSADPRLQSDAGSL